MPTVLVNTTEIAGQNVLTACPKCTLVLQVCWGKKYEYNICVYIKSNHSNDQDQLFAETRDFSYSDVMSSVCWNISVPLLYMESANHAATPVCLNTGHLPSVKTVYSLANSQFPWRSSLSEPGKPLHCRDHKISSPLAHDELHHLFIFCLLIL